MGNNRLGSGSDNEDENDEEDRKPDSLTDGDVVSELKRFTTPMARDTRLPATEKDALNVIMESGPTPQTASSREYWESIIGGGVEDVDPNVREKIAKGIRENHNNAKFMDIKRAYSHLNDDVVIIDRKGANNPLLNENDPSKESFRPLGNPDDNRTGQRFDQLTLIYQENIKENPKRPYPVSGEKTGPTDSASVLRHEFFHRVWDEQDESFKKEFRRNIPNKDVIDKELTTYSTESSEETFCEMMTIATHPKYKSKDFPKWVDNVANKTAQQLLR